MSLALERQKGGHEDDCRSPDWINLLIPFDQQRVAAQIYTGIFFPFKYFYSNICSYPLKMLCHSPVQIPLSHPRARASF